MGDIIWERVTLHYTYIFFVINLGVLAYRSEMSQNLRDLRCRHNRKQSDN